MTETVFARFSVMPQPHDRAMLPLPLPYHPSSLLYSRRTFNSFAVSCALGFLVCFICSTSRRSAGFCASAVLGNLLNLLNLVLAMHSRPYSCFARWLSDGQ